MLDITLGGAALAGLLSFLSPCILPLVPFYLSYMAGLSMQELQGSAAIPPGAGRRMALSALAFAFGVTTIFVLLGLGATALGALFLQWKDVLAWAAAAVLALFGLHFLGLLRLPFLYREARIEAKSDPSTLAGAYVMGLAFGFGWTPCVGPALAAILFLASGSGDPLRGGLLLLVYGLSMTLPFVAAALFARPFLGLVRRHRRAFGHVEKAMGAMLVVFAILIATGQVNAIGQWMLETFDWSATLS